MAWVVDLGILRLFAQLNKAYPNRSRASDGTIGDPAHAATVSDHNPETPPPPGNPNHQVDAGDFTHDPQSGCDIGKVFGAIRKSKDRRVLYMIYNRRACSGNLGPRPWEWHPYTGANPHTKHGHISVRDDTHDQVHDWQIGANDMYEQYDRDLVKATFEATQRIETALAAGADLPGITVEQLRAILREEIDSTRLRHL
jgi:hypothetical protein